MNDETMNAAYFQRSAAVPVTMVSAVSMNTIWNRNSTMTADVIGAVVHQEESALAEQAEGLAEQIDGEFAIQHGRAAQVGDRADAAHLDGEADQTSRPACRRRTP